MRIRFWLAAFLALPLVVALVYGRNHARCHHTASAFAIADDFDKSELCAMANSACCSPEGKADAPKQTPVRSSDPDKQVVFKVEGFRCPAVKGLGCGHMLYPVLASLDRIDGVQGSATNYTGTMIRIWVISANDRPKVAREVRRVLAEHHPVALAGDDFKLALENEQWRETWRVGELSAIEFHTLALHRVKSFAKVERLDQEARDKLVKIVEQQWQRLSQEAQRDRAPTPEDWGKRIRAALPAFLERSKEVLTAAQVQRFKQTLTGQCRNDDCPEAPPAPPNGEKTP